MGKRKHSMLVTGEKPEFHCASVSWGAGSLYMLLQLLEDPTVKLNMVVFVNMGKEFDALLKMRDMVLPLLQKKQVVYKEIDLKERFEYEMYHREVHKRETGEVWRIGHSWCGGRCRYGTSLKLEALYQFYRKELVDKYRVIEYVGICANEDIRVDRNLKPYTQKRYPLVERGISKGQALLGCYKRGYYWDETVLLDNGSDTRCVYLYELLDNVSCYCCRNKNLKELKNILFLLPEYWEKIKKMQHDFPDEPMKGVGKSVDELEQRFMKEGRSVSMFDIVSYPELLGTEEM